MMSVKFYLYFIHICYQDLINNSIFFLDSFHTSFWALDCFSHTVFAHNNCLYLAHNWFWILGIQKKRFLAEFCQKLLCTSPCPMECTKPSLLKIKESTLSRYLESQRHAGRWFWSIMTLRSVPADNAPRDAL